MSTNIGDLKGKVAIITGAGRGIGKTIAQALAKSGADIILVSRTSTEIEAVAKDAQQLGRKAKAITMDITNLKKIDEMTRAVVEDFGKIDILINNAGIVDKKPTEQFTEEDWDRILNTNLKGVFFCAQKVGKQMIKQNSGNIINIASIAGTLGHSNLVAYCASKGGVIQITRALACEWAKYNIRVNAIAPGHIETPLTATGATDLETRCRIKNRTPLGRSGNPSEIVGAVLYLVSDAASYTTGTVLYVDGGRTAYGG